MLGIARRCRDRDGNASAQASLPGVAGGTLPCSSPGCPRRDAVPCGYVDQRGRPCPTAWCPGHVTLSTGRPLCRRHTRQVHLCGDEFSTGRCQPDLDNRAPSLADYVGDRVEVELLNALERLSAPSRGEAVVAEPLRMARLADGGRRWERNWKIYDHTGVILRVAVGVDERADPVVEVRVDNNLVGHGIPPWISRRAQTAPELTDQEDEARRRDFYELLIASAWPAMLTDLERSRSTWYRPAVA